MRNGVHWFGLTDVCAVLGIGNPYDAARTQNWLCCQCRSGTYEMITTGDFRQRTPHPGVSLRLHVVTADVLMRSGNRGPRSRWTMAGIVKLLAIRLAELQEDK
jgi:hypothetical protein